MPKQAKKILIIEDDKFLGELLMRRFQKEGFEFTLAVTGEDGLRRASENKPDLILLDLVLPGMDGYEVLRRFKENPETSSIPVIVLTNLGQQVEKEKALNLGAEYFMVKANFTLKEIVNRVREVLGM